MSWMYVLIRRLAAWKYVGYIKIVDHLCTRRYGRESTDTELDPIQKGHPKTLKYRLRGRNGVRFIRVFPGRAGQSVSRMYQLVRELADGGCAVIRPIAIHRGLFCVFYEEPWFDGALLRERVSSLTEKQQLAVGQSVALAISKLHDSFVSQPLELLTNRLRHTLRKLKQSPRDLCGLKQEILAKVEAALPLLENRPQKLLHGDFHLQNVMLTDKGQVYIMDMETICLGDPLYDYVSIIERNARLKAFNRGVLQGTMQKFTEDDWRIMGVYYMIRKIGEYLQHPQALPEYLALPQGWAERSKLFTDPAAMREAFLFDDNVGNGGALT